MVTLPPVCFVLVRPARAENVGAAARAMKTMGLQDLRLVDSQVHREPAAQWVAHGAGDVLAAVQVHATLADALQDVDLVIGTTAKPRLALDFRVAASQLSEFLAQKVGSVRRVAVLFGCEESGLSNQDLSHCDVLSYIPLAQSQPSLNLAQAVMLYAYELARQPIATEAQVGTDEYRSLQTRLHRLLPRLGVQGDETPARWVSQRLAFATTRDVRLLHFLLGKLEQSLQPDDEMP